MKVEVILNEAGIEAHNYDREDVIRVIKDSFLSKSPRMVKPLRCTSDRGPLVFEDNGGKHDFSRILFVSGQFLFYDWFLECVSSFCFYDDDGVKEDFLAQADKVRKTHCC